MPKIFKKTEHGNTRVIIDCSEIFIEHLKSLETKAASWLEYSQHFEVFNWYLSNWIYILFVRVNTLVEEQVTKILVKTVIFLTCLTFMMKLWLIGDFRSKKKLSCCTLTAPPVKPPNDWRRTQENLENCQPMYTLRKSYKPCKNIQNFKRCALPITVIHQCDDIVRTCWTL